MSTHKPYPPTVAGLGLIPTIGLDVPITSVFLFLFFLGAVVHMTIMQVNLRRGQKFVFSGMIFGFCMARITACTMRIVWAVHPHDDSIAIAAQIFVAAGVIILFIVNVIFAQRIIRATHPHFAWVFWFSWAFKLYVASIILVIAALITCVIQSFYTRDANILRIDRDVQRFGVTYFAVAAFLPIPLVMLRYVLPKRSETETFGTGHFNTKIAILLISSTLLTLGAAFRAGIAFIPRPLTNPAWYQSKACFYLFDFTIEWLVVAAYAIMRVDKRFIVPNKSHGPGDYSRGIDGTQEKSDQDVNRVISSEEEFFDEQRVQVLTRPGTKPSEIDLEDQNVDERLEGNSGVDNHPPSASP